MWTSEGPRPVAPHTAETHLARQIYRYLTATERYIYAVYVYCETCPNPDLDTGPARMRQINLLFRRGVSLLPPLMLVLVLAVWALPEAHGSGYAVSWEPDGAQCDTSRPGPC